MAEFADVISLLIQVGCRIYVADSEHLAANVGYPCLFCYFFVMPIAVLSEDTSRAISSTLVLNDAVSIVKELLDNALDSHATNITIEVSANTLDIIQVKDNGAGIGVEDRQLLCKRNHTSKIRTIEELADLGGSSLGFRGEALASIAEMSESVLFTTRVDGESVASSMKFDSRGKLIR